MTFSPGEILTRLEAHGVKFIVIGGYAAQLHGSQRPTTDVDILPARSPENLTRLARALTSLHAKVRVDGVEGGLPFGADATSLASLKFLNLTTPWGDVDLTFEPSGTEGFEDLARKAERRAIGRGVTVLVADLDDIIRSKRAANRAKDYDALPGLLALRQTRRPDGGPPAPPPLRP